MSDPFIRERPKKLDAPPQSASLFSRIDQISSELQIIDWSGYSTAYNAPESVAPDLKLLLFGSEAQASRATHRLWCGLCHQHAYVSSAAEPALPFLLLGLKESSDPIRVDILDILLGFVVCYDPKLPFSRRIFGRLKSEYQYMFDLVSYSHQGVAELAKSIIDEIKNKETGA